MSHLTVAVGNIWLNLFAQKLCSHLTLKVHLSTYENKERTREKQSGPVK